MNLNFKNDLKGWLPQVLIIIALNFIYFYPILEGKILNQSDILMGQIKGKEIVDYRAEHGEEPLWRNHLFSGMPELSVFPNNIFAHIDPIFRVLGDPAAYIIAMMMLGMFVLLRSGKVDPWVALLGAIAVGFTGFFIISVGAGHNAKIRTAAYMAPILMSILITYRGKVLLGMLLTAFFVGLSVFSNHIQISYYTFIVILSVIITYGVYAFKSGQLPDFFKKSLLLLVAAMIGIGPNLGRLWTNYVNMKETMRGGGSELTLKENTNKGGLDYDYAMSWSYGIAETANLVFPYSTGGGSEGDYSSTEMYGLIYDNLKSRGSSDVQAHNTANQFVGQSIYWGDQSMVNGAYYIGATVFFLFIFSLLVAKTKNKPWVIAAILFSLILAWGKNLETISHLLFDYLPFYDKFRVPSMAFTIPLILIPYISFVGLNQFFKREESKSYYLKKLYQAIGISAGFGLLFWLIGTSGFSFEGARDGMVRQQFQQIGLDFNILMDDRRTLFTSSVFTSILMMAITFAVLWLFNNGNIKKPVFIAALGVLVVFDLWSFDKEQLNEEDFITQNDYKQMVRMTPADEIILKDQDPHFRVWNTTRSLTGDYATAYFHESLGGIHAYKLQRYQDLIDYQLSKGNAPALNMMNTKWVIVEDPQSGELVAQPNPGALGNAWFVNDVIWAADANEEMTTLSDFEPANEVIIGEEYRDYLDDSNLNKQGSSIRLTQYDNKELIYEANVSGGEQMAVFSEIYYAPENQAWKAYIDGEEVEHIKVNYLLRGLKIPEGQHEIVFRFEPVTYFAGNKIDLVFSIILIIGTIAVIYFEVIAKKNEAEKGTES